MTIEKYEKWKEKKNAQVNEIQENMNEKRYVCTIYETGDELMSSGDRERQIFPRRFYKICSTNELPGVLKFTQESFWTHPALLADHSNANEIPVEEKKWGIYTDVIIEPFTEELEQSYLAGSKDGFFKQQRQFHDYKMKECA